jgi:hypothetical protein
MPNRILKESICTSDTISNLSWFEEIMFYRLIVSADDFGRYDARLPILKGRMFPLDADVTVDELEEGLERLEEVGLIRIYHVDDQPYLQILSWADHQNIRAQKAKFPAPPDGIGIEEHSLPSECDVEALLFDYIGNRGEIFGHRVVTSDRQLRIDQSYMDIVVKTPSLTLILELKRGRLSNKAINQIERYMRKAGGYGVLIGCGLAGNFNLEECKEKDIAVITYDDNLNFALVQASSTVKQCYLTLNNNEITENNSYSMLASNPIQSESNPNLNPNPNVCTERSNDHSVPEPNIVIELPLNDKTFHAVTEEDVSKYRELYPAVSVEQELRNMYGWLDANPSKRKTRKGIKRFIANWLSKEQDSGGVRSRAPTYRSSDKRDNRGNFTFDGDASSVIEVDPGPRMPRLKEEPT